MVAAFAGDPAVADARMFGSSGLKVAGKRVEALIASSMAEPFDPGHGRLMKEWVALPATTSATWVELAQEARRFVSGRR